MKATIKATGEVVEVMQVYEKGESFYVRLDVLDTTEIRYHISELEFEGFETEGKFAKTCLNGIKQDIVYDPDYWTKLEHQYVGMVMQGMLSNEYTHKLYLDNKNYPIGLLNDSITMAHDLVEKLKKKEEK